MIVAIARAELHLPEVRSLKGKRRVLRSLIDRAHGRLRVSIAETNHQDLHQRAELGIALVHRDPQQAASILEQIHTLCEDHPEAQLTRWDDEYIEDFNE